MRFVGGYSDPPDWAGQGSGFSPIDPSRLPGAGVTDPPPDDDDLDIEFDTDTMGDFFGH